jgi:uncharacterized protein (DUF433 family)
MVTGPQIRVKNRMDAATRKTSAGLLGLGFYTASDAAKLLRFQPGQDLTAVKEISIGTVHRLLRGYHFKYREEMHFSQPLWDIDFPSTEGPLELSFRDLIELRFVKIFRDAGLGLPTIRLCFERAKEFVGDGRPFSTRKFRTDGKTIFIEVTRDVVEGNLIDLKRRQYVFQRVVAPSLHDLEFDAESVVRWFPLGEKRRGIVIDPRRAFGRPLADKFGVTTRTLARASRVEKSIKEVSRLFNIPVSLVREAVGFEERLAA